MGPPSEVAYGIRVAECVGTEDLEELRSTIEAARRHLQNLLPTYLLSFTTRVAARSLRFARRENEHLVIAP
jgi:hypothetical protein